MYARLTLLLDSPTYFITIKKTLIKVLQNTLMNGKKRLHVFGPIVQNKSTKFIE